MTISRGSKASKASNLSLSNEEIHCLDEAESVHSGMESCKDGSYHEIILGSKLYKITANDSKLTITNNCDTDAPPTILDLQNDSFCVSNAYPIIIEIYNLNAYRAGPVCNFIFDI